VTLVILLLALLALAAGSRSEPRALRISSAPDGIAEPQARPTPGERHDTDDGLTSQPSLSRPGVRTGKARPAMTSPAQMRRSPWQGDAAALNHPDLKGFTAIDARIPSGVSIACALTRAS